MEVLLGAGADMTARDEEGLTPLHIAAQYNTQIEAIEAILDAGADPAAKTDNGKTPWDVLQSPLAS